MVRGPTVEGGITCGGHPMLPLDADPPAGTAPEPEAAGGTRLGKRYVEVASAIELLCTKAGEGSLAYNAAALTVKDSKPLPSSD